MNKFCVIILCLLLGSCHRHLGELRPKLNYAVQDNYLKQLPSPFPPLSPTERHEDWGKEYTIGLGFAHELDLYQAMTAFKRAEILLPKSEHARLEELRYDVVLCYYLGQKYRDVVYEFEHGNLRYVTADFPAFHDLLIILYDCYLHLGEENKAEGLLDTIHHYYPETAERLAISTALSQVNFSFLSDVEPKDAELSEFLSSYQACQKSPATARTLNAFLPGSGYLYLGQYQSALTAALLNGLFIAAATHFYNHGHIAAGTIFLSFECGWYFGGIIGAGLEAKSYNERLYERLGTPMMNQKQLFPILNLRYGF